MELSADWESSESDLYEHEVVAEQARVAAAAAAARSDVADGVWMCSCCDALNASDVEACCSCDLHRPAVTPPWNAAERQRVAGELAGDLLVSSPAESLIVVSLAAASPDAADGSPGPQPLSPRDDSPMAISRDLAKRETLSASPESDDLQLASMLHGWQQLEDKDGKAYWRNWNDGQIRWNPPTASPSSESRSAFDEDEAAVRAEESAAEGGTASGESPFEVDVLASSDSGEAQHAGGGAEAEAATAIDRLAARRPTPIDGEFDGECGLEMSSDDGEYEDRASYRRSPGAEEEEEEEEKRASPPHSRSRSAGGYADRMSESPGIFGALALDGTGGPLSAAIAAVGGYSVQEPSPARSPPHSPAFSFEGGETSEATPGRTPGGGVSANTPEHFDPDVGLLAMKEEDPLGEMLEQSVEDWGWGAAPSASLASPLASSAAVGGRSTRGAEEIPPPSLSAHHNAAGADAEAEAEREWRRERRDASSSESDTESSASTSDFEDEDGLGEAMGGAAAHQAAALVAGIEAEGVGEGDFEEDDDSTTSESDTSRSAANARDGNDAFPSEEDVASDSGASDAGDVSLATGLPRAVAGGKPSPEPAQRERVSSPVGGWGRGGGGVGEVPLVARARRRAKAKKLQSPKYTKQQQRRMRQDAEVKAKILRTMKRRGRGGAAGSALDSPARSLGVERTRWGGGTQDAATEARYAEENKMAVEVTALRRRVQAMRLAQRALREQKRVAVEADVAHEERTRVEERQSLESLKRRITATLRQKKASAQRCARLGAKLAQKKKVQRRKLDAVARHKEEARRGVGATESAMARKMIPLKRRLEDLDEELQEGERLIESRRKLKLELVAAFELSVKQVTIHRRRVAKQRNETENAERADRKARARAEQAMLSSPLRSNDASPLASLTPGKRGRAAAPFASPGYGAINDALSQASLERLQIVARKKQDSLRVRLEALSDEAAADANIAVDHEQDDASPVRGTNPRNAIAKLRAAGAAAASATKEMHDAALTIEIEAMRAKDDEAHMRNRMATAQAKQRLAAARERFGDASGGLAALEKAAKGLSSQLKSLQSQHRRLLRHPRVKAANAREAHRAALHATMLRKMVDAPPDVMAFLPSRKVDGISNRKKRLRLFCEAEIMATKLGRVWRGHIVRSELGSQSAAARLVQGVARARAARSKANLRKFAIHELQRMRRGAVERASFVAHKSAALQLQAATRGRHARKERATLGRGVLRVQSCVRGRAARRQIRIEQSTGVVQRMQRGRAARDALRKQKAAATDLQRLRRGILDRRAAALQRKKKQKGGKKKKGARGGKAQKSKPRSKPRSKPTPTPKKGSKPSARGKKEELDVVVDIVPLKKKPKERVRRPRTGGGHDVRASKAKSGPAVG